MSAATDALEDGRLIGEVAAWLGGPAKTMAVVAAWHETRR